MKRSLNRKYRILQVIGTSMMAGTEKAMLSLIKKIDKGLFEIEVLCLSKGPLVQELLKNNIKFTVIERKRKVDIGLLIKLFCFLKKNRFNLIHVHSHRISSFIAKFAGCPIIVETRHGIGYLPEEMNRWKYLLYRLASKPSTKIIAVAESVKDDLIKQVGVEPERIEVIYNGVNLNLVSPDLQYNMPNFIKHFLLEKHKYSLISTFGRFDRIKGYKFLIESFKEVLKDFPNTILLLVGDGQERKNLEEFTRVLDIKKNVIFTGWQEDVLGIMKCIDIVILPSLREGLSIAGLEALSMAKPIIATSVGGNPEIVQHKINGLLVPPKDIKRLYKSILYLLSNHDLIKSYGKASRKLASERFSEEIMVNKTHDLYLQLLHKGLPGNNIYTKK